MYYRPGAIAQSLDRNLYPRLRYTSMTHRVSLNTTGSPWVLFTEGKCLQYRVMDNVSIRTGIACVIATFPTVERWMFSYKTTKNQIKHKKEHLKERLWTTFIEQDEPWPVTVTTRPT